MRFMMLMYPGLDTAIDPTDFPVELFAEMDAFNQRLSESGKMLAADGLHSSKEGAQVSFRSADRKPVVTDGPFTESKEVLGGYWLIEADSLEEAIGWARQVPNSGTEMIEVRRVYDFSDFPQEAQDAAPFEKSTRESQS